MSKRTYTDAALAEAVAAARSWRGVLRELGLQAASAGSARSVRRHADRLALPYDHFTGQRRWSDAELSHAVGVSTSWAHVAAVMQLSACGGTLGTLRAHALRLALSVDHLGEQEQPRPSRTVHRSFDPGFLRDAGSHFVATWFALRGAKVSWPLEPCRYDLVVDFGDGLTRIQVKTTESSGAEASVIISNSRRGGRALYEPGEIDAFFILDAELTGYLIPYDAVAGYARLALGRYSEFVVAERGDLVSGISVPSSP